MTTIKVLYNQTLADIAIQYLGDADRAVELAELNGVGISDELEAGQEMLIPDPDPESDNIVWTFRNQALAPSSGDGEEHKPEGIDYWQLENDFIVQ